MRCISNFSAIQTGPLAKDDILAMSLHLLTRTNHDVEGLAGYDAWEGRQHLIDCVLTKSEPIRRGAFRVKKSPSSGSLALALQLVSAKNPMQVVLGRLHSMRVSQGASRFPCTSDHHVHVVMMGSLQ